MDEALLAKIERLLRKARSTTFPEEAAAFEAKALQIMARHQVSMAMLDLEGDDLLVDLQVGGVQRGGYSTALESLFSVVCRAYACRAWFMLRSNGCSFHVYGYRSDTERVAFLYPLLAADALAQSATQRGPTSGATRHLRRNFLWGYATEVGLRFQAARDEAVAEQDAARGGVGCGLVLVERARRVDEGYLAKGLVARRRNGPGSGGFEAGRAAGRTADLSGGRNGVAARRSLSA